MHTRVPMTLRSLPPHAAPVPTVARRDLFAVLQPHATATALGSLMDEHLTLDMAQVLATGFDHDDARTLRAYLAEAARRWADTGQL